MTRDTIAKRKRKKGAEFMKLIKSYAAGLVKGASLSLLSPFALAYRITFTTKGDLGAADFLIHYDWENDHLLFEVRLSEIVPSRHIDRALTFINLINIESSCVHYVILPESGEVKVSLNLFVGRKLVSEDKIKKAIIRVLNDAASVSLLLHWLSTQKILPEALHELYLNAQSNLYHDYPGSEQMSKSYINKTLHTVVEHFREEADCGPLNEDYLNGNRLVFDLYITDELNGRMIIDIDEVLEEISLRLTPMWEVPQGSVREVLKLLPYLTFISATDHITLDPVDHQLVVNNGIILDDGVLHRQELGKVVATMLGHGFLFFPLIIEGARSGMTAQELITRYQSEVLPKVDMKHRRDMFEECY